MLYYVILNKHFMHLSMQPNVKCYEKIWNNLFALLSSCLQKKTRNKINTKFKFKKYKSDSFILKDRKEKHMKG
jgi:hypothetical protein